MSIFSIKFDLSTLKNLYISDLLTHYNISIGKTKRKSIEIDRVSLRDPHEINGKSF
jgi:hypothetical protein